MNRRRFLAAAGASVVAGCSDVVSDVNGGGKSLDENVNSYAVADAIHTEVNNHRTENNLSEIRFDDKLASIAEDHSDNMVAKDFVGHEAPDGSNFEQRYAEAGYDCRVAISANRYLSGAENIAYTWADQDVQTDDGSVNHDNDERSIATGIVRQWMDSPPHRDNIMREVWSVEGVGVSVDHEAEDGKKVIVTQNFC